jgi:hypothetical protein
MSSAAVPSSPDDGPLVVKRLPRPVQAGSQEPKMRKPPPTVQEPSDNPSKRSSFLNCKLLDHQAREDKDGVSVSGSDDNSSDGSDKSDLSCVSQGINHSNADKHHYIESLGTQQSETGYPTPVNKQRLSDDLWNGRELLTDVIEGRLQAQRLARAQEKQTDPAAYAARKANLAAAKAAREAARNARKLAAPKSPPAGIPSRPVKQLSQVAGIASSLVKQLSQVASPKKEVVLISSDSEPPLVPRIPSPAARADDVQPQKLPAARADDVQPQKLPAARADDVQPQKLTYFFKPFHRASASTFAPTNEDKFYSLVKSDNLLTSPPKLVDNALKKQQAPSPPLAVARLDPPLTITPQVLFETAAVVCSNSQHPSPLHFSQQILSPVAKSPSLPLVRAHQSPPVHPALLATFSDMSIAKKKPDIRPSPPSLAYDPPIMIQVENNFLRNRLRLNRTQPVFCSGCFVELRGDVFNAAVQTTPRSSMTQAFSAAPLDAAVQTSPRNAIESPLNVAVQTSPRFTQEQSLQTCPHDDPEKPVTAREMRSAIRELLVGLGFCLN